MFPFCLLVPINCFVTVFVKPLRLGFSNNPRSVACQVLRKRNARNYRLFRGAHAPSRADFGASPKCLLFKPKKVVGEAPTTAREGACAPQNWIAASRNCVTKNSVAKSCLVVAPVCCH